MANSSHRILIVDDSQEYRESFRRFLSSGTTGNFSIYGASTGEGGLEQAILDRPDCILLDYHLPDMTGIDFLERLPFLDGKPLMPVIMLASEGSEALAVKAIKNGAEDFLLKSKLTPGSLQITVMGALTSASLHRSMLEHRAHLHVSQTLSTTDTLERATPAILQEIGSTMNWQICTLWVTDDQTQELHCLGSWNAPTLTCSEFIEVTKAIRLSPGQDLPGSAWATGDMIHLAGSVQLKEHPRGSHLSNVSLFGAFAIPFRSPGHDSVILEAWYAHPRDISPEQFAMVNTIGEQITQFLKHTHIERNLIQRESEYRLVINHVPALLASFDVNGRFRLANHQYQNWFGISEDHIIGRKQEEILGEALYEHIRPYVEQTLRGQQKCFEWPISSTGREVRWAQATFIPETTETGKINGFYFFASDITQRKQSEERLQHQTEELARSNAELEQFAHIASHDLQEPLRKVQTFSDRLRTRCRTKLDGQELQYLERMHNATNRMQTLIRDLLTFSRAGKNSALFQPIQLSTLVREVISDLENLVTRTNATINCLNLPVIEADPTQMRQLFQNLLGNALKFHQPGRPPIIHIEGALGNQLPDIPQTPTVTITIRDNGIGFEQQYADRIFGVFQRLHGKDQYEGTGIGLSICKKVIERHQGRISVTSAPWEGTTFSLTLPVRDPGRSLHTGHTTTTTHSRKMGPPEQPGLSTALVNDSPVPNRTVPVNQ